MATPHGVNAGRVQGKDLRCRSVLSSVAARKCQDPEDASCGARKMLCGGSRVKRQGGHQTRESCNQINQMPRTCWDRLRAVMSPDGGWSDVSPRDSVSNHGPQPGR